MITFPPPLKAVGGARTGIAPVNLLDVEDVNGNLYYWADRPFSAPVVLNGAIEPYAGPLPAIPGTGQSVVWAYPSAATVTSEAEFDIATIGSTARMSASGNVNASVRIMVGSPTGSAATVMFSGFTFPALGTGAVVDKIYVVMEASGATDGVGYASFPGTTLTPPGTEFGAQLSALFWQPAGGGGGTAAEAVSAADVGISVDETILNLTPECWINLSFVALAIYYHGGVWGGYPGEAAYGAGPYIPWLVSVPGFTFNRSLKTDMGSFVIQNLSGDTLSRNFEKIARRSALEGAMFVYRSWQGDAQAAWLEVHGTLTVQSIGVDTVTLKAQPLVNPSQMDTPDLLLSETCQLQYGGARCGATSGVECNYSFQSCQVPERIFVVLNNYEKNYGEAGANVANNVINRRRAI